MPLQGLGTTLEWSHHYCVLLVTARPKASPDSAREGVTQGCNSLDVWFTVGVGRVIFRD